MTLLKNLHLVICHLRVRVVGEFVVCISRLSPMICTRLKCHPCHKMPTIFIYCTLPGIPKAVVQSDDELFAESNKRMTANRLAPLPQMGSDHGRKPFLCFHGGLLVIGDGRPIIFGFD